MLTLMATVAPSASPSSAVKGKTAAASEKRHLYGHAPQHVRGAQPRRDDQDDQDRRQGAERAPGARRQRHRTSTSPIRPIILTLGSRRWTGESFAATASTSPRPPP